MLKLGIVIWRTNTEASLRSCIHYHFTLSFTKLLLCICIVHRVLNYHYLLLSYELPKIGVEGFMLLCVRKHCPRVEIASSLIIYRCPPIYQSSHLPYCFQSPGC